MTFADFSSPFSILLSYVIDFLEFCIFTCARVFQTIALFRRKLMSHLFRRSLLELLDTFFVHRDFAQSVL